jgi:tetratricopeptide (TPR) repeat protein
LKETFKNLFESEKKEVFDDIQEKLKRWLELAQSPHFRGGPTDYYALTARGLFEAREFDEALSTLNNGLYYAESPTQIEHLYQDLGTVHYYKGYKLQPDGLALYDLNDVRNSVESYEKALRFGEDPYLYGNLGWGYYLLGDYALSVENSLKALVLKPELNYARMNLGIAYIRQGAFESAYSAYASLLGYSPELDEYQGGIRDLLELQQEFPGVYPFSNFVLGQLYRQHGRNMQAREAWRKFLSRKFPVPYWQDKTRKLLREMEAE